MNNRTYSIRNYRTEDQDRYIRLTAAAERLEPAGRPVWPDAVIAWLNRPGYSPEQYLYLVETDGELIGYMDIERELASERVILACWIQPEHRRKGLGTALHNRALSRIKGLPVKEARATAPLGSTAAAGFLSKLGFQLVREFLELTWNDTALPEHRATGAAFALRPLQQDRATELTRLQNHCFAGAWEFNPNTVEEVAYLTRSALCSPDDIVLAYDREEAIGYCWTAAIPDTAGQLRKGQVFMLGVSPDYRGQGIGKALLLAGIAHLRSRGIDTIDITVNSENKVACTLYQSTGFKLHTSTLWYQKMLD